MNGREGSESKEDESKDGGGKREGWKVRARKMHEGWMVRKG